MPTASGQTNSSSMKRGEGGSSTATVLRGRPPRRRVGSGTAMSGHLTGLTGHGLVRRPAGCAGLLQQAVELAGLAVERRADRLALEADLGEAVLEDLGDLTVERSDADRRQGQDG